LTELPNILVCGCRNRLEFLFYRYNWAQSSRRNNSKKQLYPQPTGAKLVEFRTVTNASSSQGKPCIFSFHKHKATASRSHQEATDRTTSETRTQDSNHSPTTGKCFICLGKEKRARNPDHWTPAQIIYMYHFVGLRIFEVSLCIEVKKCFVRQWLTILKCSEYRLTLCIFSLLIY
jgi:hypothetical protein